MRKGPVNAKTVFDAVKAGDRLADEIAVEFGRYLGYALANLAAAIDPSVIVIGGGVSKAGKVLIPYVETPYKERAIFCKSGCDIRAGGAWKRRWNLRSGEKMVLD